MSLTQHFISCKDLDREDVESCLQLAQKMDELLTEDTVPEILTDFILATLFFEPSTRTRLSFESAMQRLGGKVISVAQKESSSATKGETVYDSIKVIEHYADIIVMRHSDKDAPQAAIAATDKPVINAGSGADEHPTQALADMYTMHKEKGRIEGLNMVFVGDMKYGRTVHSLVSLLSLFPNNSLTFIAPKALSLPNEYQELLDKRGVSYLASETMDAALHQADVIYMTRIQAERFEKTSEYEKYKGSYILDRATVEQKCKADVTILHPLPRVDELSTDLDELPNAAYFRQAGNAVPMRMAILVKLLGKEDLILT